MSKNTKPSRTKSKTLSTAKNITITNGSKTTSKAKSIKTDITKTKLATTKNQTPANHTKTKTTSSTSTKSLKATDDIIRSTKTKTKHTNPEHNKSTAPTKITTSSQAIDETKAKPSEDKPKFKKSNFLNIFSKIIAGVLSLSSILLVTTLIRLNILPIIHLIIVILILLAITAGCSFALWYKKPKPSSKHPSISLLSYLALSILLVVIILSRPPTSSTTLNRRNTSLSNITSLLKMILSFRISKTLKTKISALSMRELRSIKMPLKS